MMGCDGRNQVQLWIALDCAAHSGPHPAASAQHDHADHSVHTIDCLVRSASASAHRRSTRSLVPSNVNSVRRKPVVVERSFVDKFKITTLQRGTRWSVLAPGRRRDPPLGTRHAYVRDELPERGGHDSLAQRGRFPDHPVDGDGIFQSEDAGPVRVLGRRAELDEPNWRRRPARSRTPQMGLRRRSAAPIWLRGTRYRCGAHATRSGHDRFPTSGRGW